MARLLFVALCLVPVTASAQTERPSIAVGAQAIGIVTRVSPAFAGRDYTEGYLTQPALMAHARFLDGRVALRATLDLEGLTLRRGELTPGVYGEGYVDRRHPHTYTHEVVGTLASSDDARRPLAASLAAGKGFAPFGTDDPMMRPFVKFPANHHLAQILERLVVIGAGRVGPVALEAGVFNGDEPVGAAAAPEWGRFGDSWSGRLTIAPRGGALAGLELQASHARVESPEYAPGGGSDQRKWSASARFERGPRAHGGGGGGSGAGDRRYALVEWARTDDVVNGRRSFDFTSVLGEGSLVWRGAELGLRLERTVRPEEERTLDVFRSERPHTDASILGRTRWDVATLHVGAPARALASIVVAPFVETSLARPTAANRPTVFEPADFYGEARQWTISAGVRLDAGATHSRMGRYGAANVLTTRAAAQEGHAMHDH